MSTWVQKLRPASFRGVPFKVDEYGKDSGRRVAVHELPGRDRPFVEDLGGSAKGFSLRAYVTGPRYHEARNRLEDALEKPGPGVLVHPRRGKMRVQVRSVRQTESTKEQGVAVFDIQFVEAGDAQAVVARPHTPTLLLSAATGAITEAMDDFSRVFDVVGMTADTVEALQDDVGLVLASVEAMVGGVASDTAALIRAPYNLAAAITGSISRLRALAAEPEQAMRLYRPLHNAGAKSHIPPLVSAGMAARAEAMGRIHLLVRAAALADSAAVLSGLAYTSANHAKAVRLEWQAAMDALFFCSLAGGIRIPDSLFRLLRALRAAFLADLRARGETLPLLTIYTPAQTTPALVIAWNLYGSAAREAEIVARNRLPHPLFAQGGRPLEVLNV
ncbi:MAG: DNA circularization N-terminal domain-containing protein [Deltaproteobacteria bacterium]|nr:DNA circularization N-terminal domain-containing protein [Deltaproteobacteria bacterium]